MGHDFFPASHADMGGSYNSYPSPLHFGNESTTQNTDNQSDAVDSLYHDAHDTGLTVPRVSYAIQQYAANIQPRNFLGLERQVVAHVVANPTLNELLGQGTLSAHVLDCQRSHSPGSMSSLSDRSLPSTSVFSRRSYASSAHSPSPSVAHTHTTYSLAGTVPSYTMPIIGEIADLHEPSELIPARCFFKLILQADCPEQYHSREDFRDHMLSHFGGFGPPATALCIFCNRDFKDEADPYSCWTEYLNHIRYQHFRNGKLIDDMRPDFVTWAYLRDIGALTPARYDEICEYANERKLSKHPWMRALDWEPPREKERKLAEERRAEEENVVWIKERPIRKKDKERSSRQRPGRGSSS